MPWNSTLTLHRDPDEAIISNEGVYGRMQVINPEVGPFYDWIRPLIELNKNYGRPFGKFLDGRYGIQLWEPSDEARVAALAYYY